VVDERGFADGAALGGTMDWVIRLDFWRRGRCEGFRDWRWKRFALEFDGTRHDDGLLGR
jgi:hypothetical protein